MGFAESISSICLKGKEHSIAGRCEDGRRVLWVSKVRKRERVDRCGCSLFTNWK